MKTKDTKFVALKSDQLRKLSEEELKVYLTEMKAEVDRLEVETVECLKQTKEDKEHSAFLKGRLFELDRGIEKQKQRLGWEGLTDDELFWLIADGLEKYWPEGKYFKRTPPTLREIREKYQEEKGAKKRDFTELEKKLVNPSGWVDRAGKYYAVDFAEHDKFAREHLIEKYGEEKAYELRKTDRGKMPFFEVLEKKFKWCRIMAWPGVATEFVLPYDLTHAQKQTLYKYCKFHLKKLPFEDDLFKN